MSDVIEWSNANTGFFSALLSILGLAISSLAIVVSIRTARLPYKKRVVLSKSFNYLMGNDLKLHSFSTMATNVGNRVISIDYLGIGFKKRGKMQKIVTMFDAKVQKGRIGPTDVFEVVYSAEELVNICKTFSGKRLYVLMNDTEGASYKKCLGRSKRILRGL